MILLLLAFINSISCYQDLKKSSIASIVSPVKQIQVSIKSSISNLVDYHNGYDMDNIYFKGNSNSGIWSLSNRTPRKFSNVNAVYNGVPIHLIFPHIIDQFTNYNFTMIGEKIFTPGDVLLFADPHPLFTSGASFFSNNERNPTSGVIAGLNVAEIQAYHSVQTNLKMVYALSSTKTTFIGFIMDPTKCSGGTCSESDHSLNDALSKWYRTVTCKINQQLVGFINSDATGLAAGSWYGVHRAVLNGALGLSDNYGYDKYSIYWTYSHEHAHEQGFS